MKGLFYKEARSLWHFGKTYLLMLVIFLGLALYQSTDSSGGAVWMLYPIFFAGTLPASLIGDDEKSGSEQINARTDGASALSVVNFHDVLPRTASDCGCLLPE